MSLQTLLGLFTEKAVAAVAGVTLTASSAAGIAIAVDNTPPDAPDFQQVVQDAQVGTDDFEAENEDAAPDEDAADVAHQIHEYKTTTDNEGCAFGLGLAAIASGGQAPSAEDACENEDRGAEGQDAAARGADNADRADEPAGNADDGLEIAEDESDTAFVPSDVPVDGEETGDDAASDHPDEGDNPGDDFRGDNPPSDG